MQLLKCVVIYQNNKSSMHISTKFSLPKNMFAWPTIRFTSKQEDLQNCKVEEKVRSTDMHLIIIMKQQKIKWIITYNGTRKFYVEINFKFYFEIKNIYQSFSLTELSVLLTEHLKVQFIGDITLQNNIYCIFYKR